MTLVEDFDTLEADALGERQPTLSPSGLGRVARDTVVVSNPLDPGAPDVGVGTVRDDCGVLARQGVLVVPAIRDPGPQLLGAQLTDGHPTVEGVPVPITLLGAPEL